MQMCRNLLYLLLLIWLIGETNGQGGFCSGRQPDVRLCTDDAETAKGRVFIDTVNVPTSQQISCECIITPFGIDAVFYFSVIYGQTVYKNMQYKVNDLVLNERFYGGITHLVGETKLYFSAFGKYRGGSCLGVFTEDKSTFNITCIKNQEHTAAPSIITTPAKFTSTRKSISSGTDSSISSKAKNVKNSSTSTSSENVTEAKTQRGVDHDKIHVVVIRTVVPMVVCALFILLVAVLVIIYLKRRRFEKDHKQQQSAAEPNVEQDHEEQNCPRNGLGGPDISVNVYERLNMYANGDLAGEMYQQLEADRTGEVKEMHDANQDRRLTKARLMVEQHDGPDIQRMINNNSAEYDIDVSPNAYERLNMYVNNNLAGEMYQQLHPDKSGDSRENTVSDSEVMSVVNSYTNVQMSSICSDAVSKPDEYENVA